MSAINECFIIKKLTNDLLQKIKFVYICFAGHTVICVTLDDDVYSYGDNTYGCLGLGHKRKIKSLKPLKIEELCQKQIICINSTCISLVALSKTGLIYAWGLNKYGQIGNGSNDNCFKPIVINGLLEKHVIDVKCGTHHCLALTINGEVFECGWSVSGKHNTLPIKVIGLEVHTITAISCGGYHSLALTENGEVFSWGENNCGQCGVGSRDTQSNPIKVKNLSDIKISKITCLPIGNSLLSENGEIYVFGSNDNPYRRASFKINKTPTKLDIETKFVDIICHSYRSNIVIGLSNNGFCYFWGKLNNKVIDVPTKSKFTDICEAFARFTKYQYQNYYFKNNFEKFTATERFKQSFNKQELSNITFKIDGKYIYAQKSYLKTVCQHFSVLFADNVWLESNAKEVEITQYSYSVYYSFLKYLYTDSVDIQSKRVIELYFLSDSYLEEDLKKKCIEIMKKLTNISNVYKFYSFAAENNLTDLEKFMFDYMIPNMSEVIKTETFLEISDITTQKFMNNVIRIGCFSQYKK